MQLVHSVEEATHSQVWWVLRSDSDWTGCKKKGWLTRDLPPVIVEGSSPSPPFHPMPVFWGGDVCRGRGGRWVNLSCVGSSPWYSSDSGQQVVVFPESFVTDHLGWDCLTGIFSPFCGEPLTAVPVETPLPRLQKRHNSLWFYPYSRRGSCRLSICCRIKGAFIPIISWPWNALVGSAPSLSSND